MLGYVRLHGGWLGLPSHFDWVALSNGIAHVCIVLAIPQQRQDLIRVVRQHNVPL